ncbi:MAG: hypothetical protein HC935_00630 [Pseudanabaena sp. SU_2_4]|nr:hypothetical protein [Pseudanabaena sp. SU_2_4]
MTTSFDLISVFAVLIAAQTLGQLSQNWANFWDDRVTWQDREIAQRLAIFILIPIGVLLHEIGHSLATWEVGGTVTTFQWRFYWGFMIPSGNFTSAESWWISFSGNLVSIILGLLPIAFIPYVRKRIVGEVLYFFVCAELVYALVGYPILSFGLQGGRLGKNLRLFGAALCINNSSLPRNFAMGIMAVISQSKSDLLAISSQLSYSNHMGKIKI